MAYGQQKQEGQRTGPPFEARWDSDCGGDDTIDAGEYIVMLDGEAWHVECARDAGYAVPETR